MADQPTDAATETAEPETLEFKGRTFKANTDISSWDIMEFFAMLRDASDDPENVNPAESLVALRDFALETVHPDDRAAFRAYARRQRASEEDLLEFVGLKVEDDAERPTGRSGDSSPGPTSTGPNSESNSAGKDSPPSGLELVKTRPDIAEFLDRAAS